MLRVRLSLAYRKSIRVIIYRHCFHSVYLTLISTVTDSKDLFMNDFDAWMKTSLPQQRVVELLLWIVCSSHERRLT